MAGWDEARHPSLFGKLHLGDHVISINNVKVSTAAKARRVLQTPGLATGAVMLLLKRTPHARVVSIPRLLGQQHLGINTQPGTSQVSNTVAINLFLTPGGKYRLHSMASLVAVFGACKFHV